MDRIGRFEIVGELGRGSAGRVYHGRDPSSGQLAAIKVLYDSAADDEDLVAYFLNEGKVLGLLNHPTIPRLYEVGEHQGLPYFALEYFEGENLAAVLRRRTELPVERKVDIVRQVAVGLDHAHQRGIVHRDVKPANIVLLADGTVKILDFGNAYAPSSGEKRPDHIIRTVDYLSPEQAMGLALDSRADLFSLGCVLYQLLAGQRPFVSETLTGMVYKICREDPTPIKEVRGTPYQWLEDVAQRCLRKDPAERFESCGELAGVLQAGLSEPRTASLGRFEVLSTLADGATGCVLKVRDPEDGSLYALRKIDTFTWDTLQKLRRSAKDATLVGHSAIVKVKEFRFDLDRPYLVMDYVEGQSLRDRLTQRTAGRGETRGSVELVRQLLLALEAAHNEGVVHGEVDPSNIMLTADGQLRLLGFGLMELRDPGRGPELPRVCYYAPERIDGERPDRRSDVYSAGVILYELLSGRRPFDGNEPYQVLQRIVFEPAPVLDAAAHPADGILQRVVQRALAKAPERRYASAYQMALDLDRHRLGGAKEAAGVAPPPRQPPGASGTDRPEFDVFLCHSFTDKPAVRELSATLTARGLRPWFDEEQLRPGLPWQELLEAQIEEIRAVAVIVGAAGLGPWQDMELRAFLNEFVKRRCPVIPVLLASCPTEPKLPIFLSRMMWVDFRRPEPDPMVQLLWGITGKRPGP